MKWDGCSIMKYEQKLNIEVLKKKMEGVCNNIIIY